jgi:flagellar hook protein FlgE
MASTTALYTGLTGLNVNSRSLDVIGNNIANANTTAFKSSRMLFATQFSRNLSGGTVPGAFNGGTNPSQVGLGAQIAGTQRNFENGGLSTTGDQRDLAVDGAGFFIVRRGDAQFYTRAGAFRQNSLNELVTVSGERVQGFAVDNEFNIVRTTLSDLKVPTGALTVAEASTAARFTGRLNTLGALPNRGSQDTFGAVFLRAGAPGPTLDATTLLTDVSASSGGAAMFADGQTFRLTGARKGTQTLGDQELAISATTTVQDLMTFIEDALAIQPAAGRNTDGTLPGVTITPAGVITVDSNQGSANTVELKPENFKLVNPDGTTANERVFSPTRVQAGDGESVRTRFVAYDSLGAPVNVDISLVYVAATGGNGTTWRWYAESPDNMLGSALPGSAVLGTGTLEFNSSGQVVNSPVFNITVNREGSGAATPLSMSIDFKSSFGDVTAVAGASATSGSTLQMVFQDGAPSGTLQSYSVGNDGVVTGAFSNGRTRPLGQIALATFVNQEGLVSIGSNLYGQGANSGVPVVSEPQSIGAGRVVGGALEQSNTELSQEFINLILASTGFSAASRVITTADQLLQQLVAIGR